MDLTSVLNAAQGADAVARQAAGQQLAALEAQNFGGFMGLLVQELASESKPAVTRQLAGLIMKNAVFSDDAARFDEKAAKWQAVDPGTKAQIRATLLATLGSPVRGEQSRQRGCRRARRRGAACGGGGRRVGPRTDCRLRRWARRATRPHRWSARLARWT
jgi:hypothetical protein